MQLSVSLFLSVSLYFTVEPEKNKLSLEGPNNDCAKLNFRLISVS